LQQDKLSEESVEITIQRWRLSLRTEDSSNKGKWRLLLRTKDSSNKGKWRLLLRTKDSSSKGDKHHNAGDNIKSPSKEPFASPALVLLITQANKNP
jgi:hypothetical protein